MVGVIVQTAAVFGLFFVGVSAGGAAAIAAAAAFLSQPPKVAAPAKDAAAG